jgi:hypothetical protein
MAKETLYLFPNPDSSCFKYAIRKNKNCFNSNKLKKLFIRYLRHSQNSSNRLHENR